MSVYGTNSVWMVTRGAYADYHVVAIFDSKPGAEEFKLKYEKANGLEPDGDWDFVEIEEKPLGVHASDIFGPFWVIHDIVLDNGTLGRYDEGPECVAYGSNPYGVAVEETGPVQQNFRHYLKLTGRYGDVATHGVLIRTVRRTEREVRSAHNIAVQQVQRQVTHDLFDWAANLS